MKLSIIIPVYNTGAYLEKCVSSALVTADEECEILLIDDGSTDGISASLCDQLSAAHTPLVRVVHQQNKGLGGARNTGIEQATGEYLLFLDSDDKLHPDTVPCVRQAIAAHGADIVTFNMTTEDENGKLDNLPGGYISERRFSLSDRPQFMLEMPSACNKAWRRELFIKSGIRFPDRVWYEDVRTTVKLYALAEKIFTLPNYLYIYFQRSDSIMHSTNLNRNSEIMDAMDDVLNWYKAEGLFDQYKSVLCALVIENVYLYASVRVLKCDVAHPLLDQFHAYTEKHFPEYRTNPHLARLPFARKLAYTLLEKKMYKLLRMLFDLKDKGSLFK